VFTKVQSLLDLAGVACREIRQGRGRTAARPACRPGVESLEDRTVPSAPGSHSYAAEMRSGHGGHHGANFGHSRGNHGARFADDRDNNGFGFGLAGLGRFFNADRRFLVSAVQGNLLEIQLAQLALQRSSNAAVRSYAQTLIADHTQALTQLQTLLQQRGIQFPGLTGGSTGGTFSTAGLSRDQMRFLQQMGSLSGAAFDQAFVTANVFIHQQAIAQFEREALRGRDPQLRSYALATLPALATHLQTALQLQATLQSQQS